MSELYLTNGTDRLDLLAANRGAKGGVAVMSMRLANWDRTTGRAVETYELAITAPTQSESIRYQQALVRFCRRAHDYFADQADTPVWLVSRTREEAGTRYAVVYSGGADDYGDVYGQPFGRDRATYEITLQLERGPWLANPPLTPRLTALSNGQGWTPASAAWSAVASTVTGNAYVFTNTTSGDCVDDDWSWEYYNGTTWVEFATTENPSYTFAAAGPRLVRLTATCTAEVESDIETKEVP